MAQPGVIVVRLSHSFEDLWEPLVQDLGGELRLVEADQVQVPTLGGALAILAAGGQEREALEWLDDHDLTSRVPVLVVGADPSRRIAVQLVGRGAADYLAMPEDLELLRNQVRTSLERAANGSEPQAEPRAHDDVFRSIVGESTSIRGLLARATKVLPHDDATVLILGETGTGKELLARALHIGSTRRKAPFVIVNCSALPSHLIESELFGHERGAFTDAHEAKPGLFEVADGGTLFLDELGTLPVELQAKLLRFLEDRQVRRVGGTKVRTVNVRIIAATNENLHQAIPDGRFRQDLFFRISVLTFSLPPLREREGDVPIIAQHLVNEMAAQHGVPIPDINADVRRALAAYHWPGNVRELKNALERALLLSNPGELDVEELFAFTAPPAADSGPIPFPASLDAITEAAAMATVELSDGNRSEAARRLQISRRRLRRLLGDEGTKNEPTGTV